MSLFKTGKKVGLIADVIRCDESEHLIWKWHPDGTAEGEHKREYAIRRGSVLRVREGEVAVFVYRQRGGALHDYIVGPFEQKLGTKNLPVIGALIDAFWGGDTPFQAEVYFINTAKNVQIKFGVPFFDVCDVRFPDIAVPVAVRGTVNFKIDDYKEFVKIYRLENFKVEELGARIRDAVVRYVKNVVTNLPEIHKIPIVQLERRITYVNQIVELNVVKRLHDDFGVTVTGVDVSNIELDKESEGYRELMSVTKDVATATARATAEADIAEIEAHGEARAKSARARAAAEDEDYAETMRIKREEDAYARRMKTKSENIGVLSIEEESKVKIAGAEALGKMGEGGAGVVDLGGGGFSPGGLAAGMAIGSVVGESVSGMVRSAMTGAGIGAAASAAVPPPIPTVAFHVAKDGVPTGPFDISTLTAMAASGAIKGDTLVWRSGMSAWARADSVAELAGLFPPPITS